MEGNWYLSARCLLEMTGKEDPALSTRNLKFDFKSSVLGMGCVKHIGEVKTSQGGEKISRHAEALPLSGDQYRK